MRKLGPRYLDHRVFGRGSKRPVEDRRPVGPKIRFDPYPTELFPGNTVVLSPHFDDAGLNYGLGINRKARAKGGVHIINLLPGNNAPIKGVDSRGGRTEARFAEAKKEAKVLGAPMTYLGLENLYRQKRFNNAESRRFFSTLDELGPRTLVIPSENDAHLDHRNVRQKALDWAAERAWKGKPVVVVEADSMWGTVPEIHITHSLGFGPGEEEVVGVARKAHRTQWERTDFPRVAEHKARAKGVILGEHKHGLVEKTPDIGPQETYSQNILHKKGERLILEQLTPKLRKRYKL
ncbi:MAG: PIG-L family deacetylase [Candidatus Altiarchaeota archaeon]|nr:PIG-L family deacetylase [Candidatus Altiarchaeota archaeon]